MKVTTADGKTREWCLLLADTEQARERGLMNVDDPALGGYDGMVFAYDKDDSGAFWMKNTLLPLSIVFLHADGTIVSTSDMEPCPADERTCPTYPARGAYRTAIEVTKGRLDALGITEGAKVELGAHACAAVSS